MVEKKRVGGSLERKSKGEGSVGCADDKVGRQLGQGAQKKNEYREACTEGAREKSKGVALKGFGQKEGRPDNKGRTA